MFFEILSKEIYSRRGILGTTLVLVEVEFPTHEVVMQRQSK